jgi:hypothetical protein
LLLDDRGARTHQSRGPYYRAAAVLTEFDPQSLQPAPGERPRSGELQELLSDCELLPDRGHRCALRDAVRRLELRAFSDLEAMQNALTVNRLVWPDDDIQAMLVAYCLRKAEPLPKQTLSQLSGTVQVCSWLQDTEVAQELDLPSYDDALEWHEWVELLHTLREARTEHFLGREAELAFLKSCVAQPSNHPTVIWGVGGVGKTALTAAFLLEHVSPEADPRCPFVWLDFYRSSLVRGEDPRVLLQEAALYLARQGYGKAARQQLVAFAEVIREIISPAKAGSDIIRAAEVDHRLDEFVRIVKAIGLGELPLLWVFDSLEELQYEAGGFPDYLWDFCQKLQAQMPQLRCFLIGRNLIFDQDQCSVRQLHLESLEPLAATQLAQRLGVDPDRAGELVETVGRHPLTIRVAAEIYVREARKGGLQGGWDNLLFILRTLPEASTKVLFRRFVAHLHDDEVRRLVDPGLILRRVSHDLIEKVLSGPCGLNVRRKGRAFELFNKLKRETSLVDLVDESLHFKTEIRRELLPAIRSARADQVTEIHNLAITYYAQQTPRTGVIRTADRGEEIYHRLAIGQTGAPVDNRWIDGVEEFLAGAIEELPYVSQAYLAAKIGVSAPSVPEKVWRQKVDQLTWERRTATRVRGRLNLDEPVMLAWPLR